MEEVELIIEDKWVIINNSLEHSYETEKGSLLWWELNLIPLMCQTSTLDY